MTEHQYTWIRWRAVETGTALVHRVKSLYVVFIAGSDEERATQAENKSCQPFSLAIWFHKYAVDLMVRKAESLLYNGKHRVDYLDNYKTKNNHHSFGNPRVQKRGGKQIHFKVLCPEERCGIYSSRS